MSRQSIGRIETGLYCKKAHSAYPNLIVPRRVGSLDTDSKSLVCPHFVGCTISSGDLCYSVLSNSIFRKAWYHSGIPCVLNVAGPPKACCIHQRTFSVGRTTLFCPAFACEIMLRQRTFRTCESVRSGVRRFKKSKATTTPHSQWQGALLRGRGPRLPCLHLSPSNI